ncbi:MAG: BBP7 family outer membrane beta-barrel protein [Planctomycetales bacterium]|nr:BBP7 family outer membrane beta-barrel protein [Planctomycetales bacterium]
MRRTSIFFASLLVICSTLQTIRADEPARLRITDGQTAEAGTASLTDTPLPPIDTPPINQPIVNYDSSFDADSIFAEPAYPWYARTEAIFLRRTPISGQAVVVEDMNSGLGAPNTVVRVDANNLSFNNNAQPAFGFTLGRQLDNVSSFEASYWGLLHWTSGSVTYGANSLSLNGPIAITTQDFFLADEIAISYVSNLNNMELNYKQTINGLSLLGGFRLVSLSEDFNIRSHDVDSGTSNYRIKTVNTLIGGQIGAGWNWTPDDRVTLDLFSKVGVFGNIQRMTQTLADLNNTLPRLNARDGSTHTGFVGEVGANVQYRVTEWLTLNGGYRFMWIDGLALAPNQLDFTDISSPDRTLSDSGSSFKLYGPHFGAEIRW